MNTTCAMTTLLIVDDSIDIRHSLMQLFMEEGYLCGEASNGKEALEYIRSGKPCDLIVLDLMMPVMSGCEFLQVYAQEEALYKIPVVVISAHHKPTLKVCGFVPKPFDLDKLFGQVEKCLIRYRGKQ